MMCIRLILIAIIFLFFHAPTVLAGAYEDALNAVQSNDIMAAEALFAKGLDVNITDAAANSLLMIAVRENHPDMVKRLLTRQARVSARNSFGETALMLAAAKGNLEVMRILIEHGAAIRQTGWNALIYAAWQGHTEVVKFLLGKGAEIDAVSPNGVSALMLAARGGHIETVKLLLSEVAEPNLKTDTGATALAWALKEGHAEVAEMLKQRGARDVAPSK